jgi:hypothetical protein
MKSSINTKKQKNPKNNTLQSNKPHKSVRNKADTSPTTTFPLSKKTKITMNKASKQSEATSNQPNIPEDQ